MENIEEEQSIIPGLPDDSSLRCLAMLSHGYHGTLECVSKKWRDLVRSDDYSCYKARNGWSGNWLFVLTEGYKNQWVAYDPEADRWHPLPINNISVFQDGWEHSGFECVCVSSCLFVIGGCYKSSSRHEKTVVTNDVMRFDLFKKEWKKVASMRTKRAFFACGVVSGKVYVAGVEMSWSTVVDIWPAVRPRKYVAQGMKKDRLYTVVGGRLIKTRGTDGGEWYEVGLVPGVVLPGHPGEAPLIGYRFEALRDELYVIGGLVLSLEGLDEGRCDLVRLSVAKVCNLLDRPLIWRETKPMCIQACGPVIGCVSLEESSPP
ncbi:unnamed protein product [Eruca vesicaria subsp. sativa]|uniref:F-box domain-containing protein n=1 Tax=Eruca vesicaria subsp. sativa TaxID=29727 RepID=A0ABC8LCT2_ERUVS|nr:unnamed protein product [Eruca vesicaria subsp. sativa]